MMILPLLLSLTLQSPQERMGLTPHEDALTPGYILIAPLKSKTTFLIEKTSKKVAHKWESSELPGNSVYLMDDGDLLRTTAPGGNEVFKGGGAGGGVQRISWEGDLIWELDWSDDTRLSHHDIEPLPNGNLLLISWEHKTAEEAFEAGRDPEYINDSGIWPDYVVEVKPPVGLEANAGEIVWEWHAWDHLVQERAPSKANYGKVAELPGRIAINGDLTIKTAAQLAREAELEEEMKGLGYIGDDSGDDGNDGKSQEVPGAKPDTQGRQKGGDWLHTNGIDYDPIHDLIVISSRVFSEVWIIDHSTTTEEARTSEGGRFGKGGDLLWRWGNPSRYGAGDAGDQTLFKQHDPSFIPEGSPGAGNLLIYNNGEGRPSGAYSSIVELELPLNEEGDAFPRFTDAFGPVQPAWEVGAKEGGPKLSFFSSFISGAERLTTGNTLICVGASGRILEVTQEGELVWEYVWPVQDLPAGRRPQGRGDRPNRPEGGGPPGKPRAGGRPGGPGGGGPGGGRGGPDLRNAIFRAIQILPSHPGIALLQNSPKPESNAD